MKQRILYTVAAIGGGLGIASAFLQTIEKLLMLQGKDSLVPCNINSVFSCSAVLSAWQSSLFGFPNSLMCLVLFTTFTATAFVGAMGGTLTRNTRLIIQGLTLFTLGFALWFLWTSTYVIGAICMFCLVCFTGLLTINWAWLRLNAADLPISKKAREYLQVFINKGFDTLFWVSLGAVVGLLIAARFLQV